MKTRAALSGFLLALAAAAGPAVGQHAAGAAHRASPPPLSVAARQALGTPPAATGLRAGSRLRTVGFALGGSLVGAWSGFLVSQALKSDWDKASNGEFRSHRVQYAAAGAALGAGGGIVLGRRSAPPYVIAPTIGARRLQVIGRDEIEQFGAGTVYQLIETRRPMWLRKRNTTPSGEMLPMWVYVDEMRLDDVRQLRQLTTTDVLSVEYYDGTAATLRFGWDHPQGAIVVSTVERGTTPGIR